jgi:crotonobetaine/carnitine-CoA ligase
MVDTRDALAPAGATLPPKDTWAVPTQLYARAHRTPDKVFITAEDGESLTFAQTLTRAERTAAGLAALGVKQGDRVVLVMDNSPDLVVTWFAVNLLGGVEVPMNVANQGNSLAHVFNNSGAEVAVVDDRHVAGVVGSGPALENLRYLVVRGGSVPTEVDWQCHTLEDVATCTAPFEPVEVSYSDTGAIMYTSGTTGPAKGVVMPHAHMYLFARHLVDNLRLTEDDVHMVCLPLFHANAQLMQAYASLIAGARIAIYPRFSASAWSRQIVECGATVTSLLGIMAQFIHNQPPSKIDRAHKVTRMVTIPLPSVIADDFERRFGVTCVEAYGMTETCLPMYRPIDEPLRPGSCGKVLSDWFEVAIVDPETDEPLPTGEVGEIVVRPRSPFTTFSGYHAMPDRTVEAWRNLWFHTGDAGRCDQDGYFYFADRTADRIRRRGENVTAYDIEVVLTELPQVLEAAVIGVPASEGEDDIKAVIVTEPGCFVDPAQILEHCRPRLPYFALPRYLEVVSELPKTGNGKVLKRLLRAHRVTDDEWDLATVTERVKTGVK